MWKAARPSPQPRATFLSRKQKCSLAAVHLVLHSRAAARVQAGSSAVVHGHSSGSSQWVCACRSRPGQVAQLVHRVWPSNSGALSSVGRPRYQLPHRAPPTTLISTLRLASPPSATGRASPLWCSLGMPFQWSVSNALRAAQSPIRTIVGRVGFVCRDPLSRPMGARRRLRGRGGAHSLRSVAPLWRLPW